MTISINKRLIKLIKDALSTLYKERTMRVILEDCGFIPGQADEASYTPDGNPTKRMVAGMYLDRADWVSITTQKQLADVIQQLLYDHRMVDYDEALTTPETKSLFAHIESFATECGYSTENSVVSVSDQGAALVAESTAFTVFDLPSVRDDFQRVRANVAKDVNAAITASMSLLESVCKHLLDVRGVSYETKIDLKDLMKLTIAEYELAKGPSGEPIVHLLKVAAHNVYETRRICGMAHGHGKNDPDADISPEAGELVVDLCFTISKFLLVTEKVKE